MITVGSQLIAEFATVRTSPENRASRSPVEYCRMDIHWEDISFRNTKLRTSPSISTPSRAENRAEKPRNTMPATATATVAAANGSSRERSMATMQSMRYLPSTPDSSPMALVMTPNRVYSATENQRPRVKEKIHFQSANTLFSEPSFAFWRRMRTASEPDASGCSGSSFCVCSILTFLSAENGT